MIIKCSIDRHSYWEERAGAMKLGARRLKGLEMKVSMLMEIFLVCSFSPRTLPVFSAMLALNLFHVCALLIQFYHFSTSLSGAPLFYYFLLHLSVVQLLKAWMIFFQVYLNNLRILDMGTVQPYAVTFIVFFSFISKCQRRAH